VLLKTSLICFKYLNKYYRSPEYTVKSIRSTPIKFSFDEAFITKDQDRVALKSPVLIEPIKLKGLLGFESNLS